MKAFLKNHRQAPRKLRVIANGVRGKNVAKVLADLSIMPQKGSATLRKLVASAVANAKQTDPSLKETGLIVKTITVDKGITYVRFMPRAMGRATPINRECSHIRVELAPDVRAVEEAKSITKSVASKEKTAPAKNAAKKTSSAKDK